MNVSKCGTQSLTIIQTCQFGWINISYIYEVDIILMTLLNKKKMSIW